MQTFISFLELLAADRHFIKANSVLGTMITKALDKLVFLYNLNGKRGKKAQQQTNI